MTVSGKDREVLRGLACRVAEIAALPAQQEAIALWKALNGLRPLRAAVAIDQLPWHEMDVDTELALRTGGGFCRDLETGLRRTLYRWKHLRVDMVVEPVVDVARVIRSSGFGITTEERTVALDPANDVVGHLYIDQLASEEDLGKMRRPEISLDERATAEAEEAAHDILDGILEVRMQGWFPVFAPWDAITTWRGAGAVLLDLADRPEFMHRIIARLTDAHLAMLDTLEDQGLLGHGQAAIHCTGAYTDELPAPGHDPRKPRPRDLWTYSMAQVFAAVSPAMQKEFDLDYAARWCDRFGLVYYGCCEPLHTKIDLIRALPHVRKISMSPWADQEQGAERIGRDFVFSRKPSPAFLAVDAWDAGAVERDLRQTLRMCARHGCPVELILKDISTVRYQPQRLWQWAEIAAQVVAE